jgi:hypothetical protein
MYVKQKELTRVAKIIESVLAHIFPQDPKRQSNIT